MCWRASGGHKGADAEEARSKQRGDCALVHAATHRHYRRAEMHHALRPVCYGRGIQLHPPLGLLSRRLNLCHEQLLLQTKHSQPVSCPALRPLVDSP